MDPNMVDIGNLSDLAVIGLLAREFFRWVQQSKFEHVFKTFLDFLTHKNRNKRKQSINTIKDLSKEVQVLKEKNNSLYNELKKAVVVDKILDTIRDKYNFRRAYTLIFSNGTSDISGSGMYYYSIMNESHFYLESSIKELYQKKPINSLASWIAQISEFEVWDSNNFTDQSEKPDTQFSLLSDIKNYMLIHSIERLLALPIFYDDILLGLLLFEVNNNSTFPSTIVEEFTYDQALADLLLQKHKLETVYQKYN